VDIYLLNQSFPAAEIFLSIQARVTLIASTYIFLSLSSIYFSKFPIRGRAVAIAYVCLLFVLLLAVLLVPILPMWRRLSRQKKDLLRKINFLLHTRVYDVLEAIESQEDSESSAADLERLNMLHDKVSACHALPSAFTIYKSIAGILVATIGPAILSYISSKFFNLSIV
jgi:hypothetical protein